MYIFSLATYFLCAFVIHIYTILTKHKESECAEIGAVKVRERFLLHIPKPVLLWHAFGTIPSLIRRKRHLEDKLIL